MAMGRYGVKTKLSPEEVIQKAKAYFGGQMGLTIVEEGACCISFEGGGGFVEISVTQEDDKTDVDLTTREWMFDVQQFMKAIGSRGR
ncbi:MAG TPA: hypothetical protein PKZ84_14495 [Anaerolineae bacterium]|nr:hypothetical protein [Anaerolineae bacterium]HQI85551.1 hypothetical protein [Anaerolineae bacterium]